MIFFTSDTVHRHELEQWRSIRQVSFELKDKEVSIEVVNLDATLFEGFIDEFSDLGINASFDVDPQSAFQKALIECVIVAKEPVHMGSYRTKIICNASGNWNDSAFEYVPNDDADYIGKVKTAFETLLDKVRKKTETSM